jgi:hypothetical protein
LKRRSLRAEGLQLLLSSDLRHQHARFLLLISPRDDLFVLEELRKNLVNVNQEGIVSKLTSSFLFEEIEETVFEACFRGIRGG